MRPPRHPSPSCFIPDDPRGGAREPWASSRRTLGDAARGAADTPAGWLGLLATLVARWARGGVVAVQLPTAGCRVAVDLRSDPTVVEVVAAFGELLDGGAPRSVVTRVGEQDEQACQVALRVGEAGADRACEVTLSVTTGERAELAAAYPPSRFAERTATTWLESAEALLGAAAAAPHVAVSSLPLTSARMADELLALGRGPAGPGGEPGDVLEDFWTCAEATPDATAIVGAGGGLTYGEAAAAVRRIGCALAARGAGAGSAVALHLDRTEWLPLSVMGVLAAGAAYVPLSLRDPVERRRFQCADADVALLLTRRGLELPELVERDRVVTLEELLGDGEAPAALPAAGPRDAAYVIYTSGTSGQPKGVVVERAALSVFAKNAVRLYELTAADRILQFADVAADPSVLETMGALTTGASLHVATEDERLDPFALGERMSAERVTVADLPPGVVPFVEPEAVPDLRLLSVGGEAFSAAIALPWVRDGRRFLDAYGPTEATCTVTLHDCDGTEHGTPPIGVPFPDQRAYVVDEALRLVPRGAAGELALAGSQLARGYVGRPDETAARFVPDPFARGERMYRTGDLARWNAAGELEFLGRIDRQVKVRGFRVELEEVEAVLRRDAAVRQAAVTVREDDRGKALVAFVVPADPAGGADGLAERARATLPAAAVPSEFHVMESLPVNRVGKVDTRRLEALAGRPRVGEHYGGESAL
jgi:amino acid adenylation domain-containing protein